MWSIIYEVYTRHSLLHPEGCLTYVLGALGSQTEACNAPKRKSMYLETQESHLTRYFRKLELRFFSLHSQDGDPCRFSQPSWIFTSPGRWKGNNLWLRRIEASELRVKTKHDIVAYNDFVFYVCFPPSPPPHSVAVHEHGKAPDGMTCTSWSLMNEL